MAILGLVNYKKYGESGRCGKHRITAFVYYTNENDQLVLRQELHVLLYVYTRQQFTVSECAVHITDYLLSSVCVQII
jgi:hypothetical protein